jgi:hypothetical protein
VQVKTGDSTVLLQEIQIGQHPPAVPSWPLGTRLGVAAPHRSSEPLLSQPLNLSTRELT